MPREMDHKQYTRLLTTVLDEISERKIAKEAVLETELIPNSSERSYTIDDVVDAVSQMDPSDAQLARTIVNDIENRMRPRSLLTSIDDKVELYRGIKKEKTELVFKNIYVKLDSNRKNYLEILVKQGTFEKKEIKHYVSEIETLSLAITGEVTDYFIQNGMVHTAIKYAVLSYLITEASLIAIDLLFVKDFPLAALGIVFSILSATIGAGIAEELKERKNKREALKNCAEFKENLAYRLKNIDTMTKSLLEKIESDNILAYDSSDEEKIIESVSHLRSYFSGLIEVIPQIKKNYVRLKEAEAGLPVKESEALLLPAAK